MSKEYAPVNEISFLTFTADSEGGWRNNLYPKPEPKPEPPPRETIMIDVSEIPIQTQLDAPLEPAPEDTITVGDTTGFPSNGYITVDWHGKPTN